jgi:hypothetical protein
MSETINYDMLKGITYPSPPYLLFIAFWVIISVIIILIVKIFFNWRDKEE